ncbi:Phenylalanyl-tRNA synthetase, beta subunit, cytoplasmic [Saitoella coloradoensis]
MAPSTESLQSLILTTLDTDSSIPDTLSLISPDGTALEQLQIQGALNSLAAREMLTYKNITRDTWVLTPEAEGLLAEGSYEARVFEVVRAALEGMTIQDLQAKVGKEVAGLGQKAAFRNKWIKQDNGKLVKCVDEVEDVTQAQLKEVKESGNLKDAKVLADLKKRKLVALQKSLSFSVEKGPKFSTTIQKLETDLTAEMIASGSWRKTEFKKYNFNAQGVPPAGGALHPLMKVREEFRNIFFEMGFQEMPTNKFVESSFWNFDALFVPQQHPARDMQDTFFIKDPQVAGLPEDKEYVKRVADVHEKGGFGSIGYRYPYKEEETEKLVLRTHTTSISTNVLYKLANAPGGFKPAKYFSIDRVFRNESVDATHLAEFHQVEGVIADYNLTLGDLIGFMETFFAKMGVTNLRFKPAYNPYTEPSMEIFSYHSGLKRWVEIGNSGLFRPEMLEPMGLPKGVRVIGWGLSLERPTMIKYGVDNIRELLGHKVSLGFIGSNPAVRLDKKMGREAVKEEATAE